MNTVVQSRGIPDLWSAVISGALLATSMAVVWRSRTVWGLLLVFVAPFATHATLRVGSVPAFLAFEGALVLVATALWRRRDPTPG